MLGRTRTVDSSELRRWEALLTKGVTHSFPQRHSCGIGLSLSPFYIVVSECHKKSLVMQGLGKQLHSGKFSAVL